MINYQQIRFGLIVIVATFLTQSLTAQQVDSIPQSVPDSLIVDKVIDDTFLEPLGSPDINSPRASLLYFIDNINRSHQILMEVHEHNLEIPGFFVADELKNKVKQAELLFARATSCMDLNAFPPSLQKDLGYGRAIMLKEIFDRIELPPLSEIPDAAAVDFDFENNKYPKLEYWQIPNTEIILVRAERGILRGQYLFSSESVEKLPYLYQQIKHLPYKSDTTISKGFYSFYVSTPGFLMPPRWSIFLPEWSNKVYFSQTLWQWIAVLFFFAISIFLITLLYKLFIKVFKEFSIATKEWGRVIFFSLTILIIVFLSNILDNQINLTGNTLLVIIISLESIRWALMSFLSFNILIAISETVIRDPTLARIGIEATYTRATFMVLATLVSITVIIVGLSQIGVSILPLLTGVGIGGLAIALAARSTLENVIASFTIFADKPYRVNERVKVMDYNGTIESIGIRSTQIRLLTGPLVSVPNEKMATVEIENIQKRPYLRQEFDIRIKYESSPDMVEKSIQIIKDILSLPETEDDEYHPNKAINREGYPPRVHFNKINNDSFNIYVIYWFFPPDWWEFMQHAEKINFQIIKRLNEASIDFAFPTQMLHLSEHSTHTNDRNHPKEKK